MDKNRMNIVIFGAGAIGGSLGSWISPHHSNVFMLDKGEIAEAMKKNGIVSYKYEEKENAVTIPVKVIDDISEVKDIDVIAIAVKNYSLDAVASMLKGKVKEDTVILALQNGVENQKILPKYFKNVIYCVIEFNAWMDAPGVIGYQNKGPFIIGTLDNSLQEEMIAISDILNKGVKTVITSRFKDAAHCKMIINLTNSFTTLVGFKYKEITDFRLFKKILTNSMYEGVQIMKSSGIKEYKMGHVPPWSKIMSAAKLPNFITDGMFKKNLSKMVLSSMGQDVLQRKGKDTELESLNGYFISLANKNGIKAPYNRAVYELCKKEFSRSKFKPLDVTDVWKAVQEKMK